MREKKKLIKVEGEEPFVKILKEDLSKAFCNRAYEQIWVTDPTMDCGET